MRLSIREQVLNSRGFLSMTYTKQNHRASRHLLVFVFALGGLPTSTAIAQDRDRSPSDLVKFLTYQSGRSKDFVLSGIQSCELSVRMRNGPSFREVSLRQASVQGLERIGRPP